MSLRTAWSTELLPGHPGPQTNPHLPTPQKFRNMFDAVPKLHDFCPFLGEWLEKGTGSSLGSLGGRYLHLGRLSV